MISDRKGVDALIPRPPCLVERGRHDEPHAIFGGCSGEKLLTSKSVPMHVSLSLLSLSLSLLNCSHLIYIYILSLFVEYI